MKTVVTKRVIIPSRLEPEPPREAAVESETKAADAFPDTTANDTPAPPAAVMAAERQDESPAVVAVDRHDESPLHATSQLRAESSPTASSFWPLFICTAAWLAWMGFHSVQLNLDRQSLRAAVAQLQPTVDKSAQVRQALDALAVDTHRLADGGNAGARQVVEELKRRGVTINPAAPPASAPK